MADLELGRHRLSLLVLAGLAVFAAGCPGGDPQPLRLASAANSAQIGPAGGTVTSSDGRASIVIPPGALSSETVITVDPAATYPPAQLLLGAYDFGPEGTQFAVPATLTFVYEDAEIPAGATADDLRWAGVANGQWVGLETTHDASARMLTAEVTHFSTYGAGMFPNNEPPTLLISEPASDMLVSYGGMVQIEYTDDDPDDGAATWLFADKDGDLDTIDDTIVLAHVRPERDGSRQRVVWCAADAQTPPGIYHLMGATWDGTNPPVIAEAPCVAILYENVAFALRGGGGGRDYGHAIATFADGSCVVAGTFAGSATFDSASPETPATELVSATSAMFVARYDAGGRLTWITQAESVNPSAIVSFPDGSCAVTGRYYPGATFEPGKPLPDGSGEFVARYEAGGTLAWVTRITEQPPDGWAVPRIAGSPDGSCVVISTLPGQVVLDPGGAQILLGGDGQTSYAARYGEDGALLWARSVVEQAEGGHGITGIAALEDGAFFLCGNFAGEATFGPGHANEKTHSSCLEYILVGPHTVDPFVIRCDTDGNLRWVRFPASGPGENVASATAAHPNGSCSITGSFEALLTWDAEGNLLPVIESTGGTDVYVARLGEDGASWLRRAGGDSSDRGRTITALPDGSCVVAGEYSDSATFGPGEANQTVLSTPVSGFAWPFLARFARDGDVVWAKSAIDRGSVQVDAIAAFDDGSFVITGILARFLGETRFDSPTSIPNPLTLMSAGQTDMLLARFNADGSFGLVERPFFPEPPPNHEDPELPPFLR